MFQNVCVKPNWNQNSLFQFCIPCKRRPWEYLLNVLAFQVIAMYCILAYLSTNPFMALHYISRKVSHRMWNCFVEMSECNDKPRMHWLTNENAMQCHMAIWQTVLRLRSVCLGTWSPDMPESNQNKTCSFKVYKISKTF